MKPTFLVSLFLSVVLIAPTRANDSGIAGVGGRWKLLKAEHRNVRMVSERVQMEIFRAHYDVVADFVFHNHGAAQTVEMGFPESGFGDVGAMTENGGFLRFSTSVDNQPIKAVRRILTSGVAGDYQTVWAKSVRFGRNQTRRVQVRYRSPLGSSISYNLNYFAAYNFTGGNWRGTVSESRLDIVLRAPGTHAVVAHAGGKPIQLKQNNNRWTHTWRNWQAQTEFYFTFAAVPRGWLWEPESRPFEDSSKVQSATVAGASDSIDFAPPALQRDGQTWVALQWLQQELAERAEIQMKGLGAQETALTWNATTRASILRAGRFEWTIRAGDRTMRVRDKMNPQRAPIMTLPAAPFTLRSMGQNRVYVPLAPILKMLDGRATIDTKARRIALQIPSFLEPG